MASKKRKLIEGLMPKKDKKFNVTETKPGDKPWWVKEGLGKKPKTKKPVVATKTNGKPVVTPPPTKAKLPIGKIAAATALTGGTAALIGTTAYLESKRKKSHKVKSGDSLSKIAKEMGTTLKKLLEANNIKPKDANNIRVGQTIKAPPKGSALKSPGIYKGMSKSVMAKLHAETEKRKAANRKKRLAKKHTGGRLGRMGGAGLSPAEMARAGVMSEAQRRREAGRGLYAKKGGKVGKKKGGIVNRMHGGQIGTAFVATQYAPRKR
jgi:LysM repeat protein